MTSAKGGSRVPDDRTWTIAEMAEDFDVTHRTIRHYEELGLLSPERVGTRRIYRRRDRVRLELVLRGKRLGFSLEESARLINLYESDRGHRGQLETALGTIEERRADLQARRADIEAALRELDRWEADCRADLAALRGSELP